MVAALVAGSRCTGRTFAAGAAGSLGTGPSGCRRSCSLVAAAVASTSEVVSSPVWTFPPAGGKAAEVRRTGLVRIAVADCMVPLKNT